MSSLEKNYQFISKFFQKKTEVFLIIFLFWIISFPTLLEPTMGGLDPSWVLGLHLSKINEYVWGKDIFFTFGPFGYLFHPINIEQSLWVHGIIFKIISVSLFYFVLGLFSISTIHPLRNAIILGTLSVPLIPFAIEYYPIIALYLGFYLFLQKKNNSYFLIPLVLATSFLFFLKFDGVVLSTSVLVLASIFLVFKKRWKELTICGLLYPISVLLIWIGLTGTTNNIFNHVFTSYKIAEEYSIGVSTITPFTNFVFIAIPAWLLIFWWFIEYYKKERSNLKILYLSPILLFVFYKLGFMREGHMFLFFFLWAILLFIIFSVNNTGKINKILKYSTIILIIIFVFLGFVTVAGFRPPILTLEDDFASWANKIGTWTIRPYTTLSIQYIPNYVDILLDENSFESKRNEQKNNIKNSYPIIEQKILSMFENKTVNVYPWDIAYVYAYDLNWKPSPLIQNYVGISPYLDELDAEFYNNTRSPNFILFKLAAIDKQQPSFAEPATLRSILCNYHKVTSIHEFQLLEKNEQNICSQERIILAKDVKFNETIHVPKNYDGYLLAKISIKRNQLGDIAKIFYKPPPVFIELNENNLQYKFTYSNAISGIILTSTTNNESLVNILENDVESFKITTYDERFFEELIYVEFNEIQLNQ